MIVKLTLTDEHIKLIQALNPTVDDHDNVTFNPNSLWGGAYLFEDVALILGFYDEQLEGTENDFEGRRYSPEREKHMLELYDFIKNNLLYIESLVHQFSIKGGLTPGTYKCIDYQLNWEKIQE
mgnify:CR=1 FL=1